MDIEISPPLLTENRGKTLAIVVGGGPAPGINGVIRAVTIEAIENGLTVLGVLEGFKWLAQGDTTHIQKLNVDDVSRIHLQGGSIIGTSREAPARDPGKMERTIRALRELEVDYLVSIGGDDTAFSASQVDKLTGREIEIAHVPKTIDNDLPLPSGIPTFGYQTARQVGVDLISNLMEDAKTTQRWYFVVAMGRSAGHLALGMGKAAGATLTIIPEEFRDKKVPLTQMTRILEGGIIKHRAAGRNYGVAIIAEGAAESVDQDGFSEIKDVERDEHGHVRLAELPFGKILKQRVRQALADQGVKVTIVDKNIGYELRCASPTAMDMEYTQDLGSAAIRSLRGGNTGVLVCMRGADIMPLRLSELLDPKTGRMRVRRVDVDSSAYALARRYMLRLGSADFEGQALVELSKAAGLSPEKFKERYGEQARPW
ncbi:MAG: 6-phosphofructokinase [Deltaproteobacteria bacterium]|nr:6-phosphofructokinase [Deltaproteobacteria bacterium]